MCENLYPFQQVSDACMGVSKEMYIHVYVFNFLFFILCAYVVRLHHRKPK